MEGAGGVEPGPEVALVVRDAFQDWGLGLGTEVLWRLLRVAGQELGLGLGLGAEAFPGSTREVTRTPACVKSLLRFCFDRGRAPSPRVLALFAAQGPRRNTGQGCPKPRRTPACRSPEEGPEWQYTPDGDPRQRAIRRPAPGNSSVQPCHIRPRKGSMLPHWKRCGQRAFAHLAWWISRPLYGGGSGTDGVPALTPVFTLMTSPLDWLFLGTRSSAASNHLLSP
jgi:hypothetical protein